MVLVIFVKECFVWTCSMSTSKVWNLHDIVEEFLQECFWTMNLTYLCSFSLSFQILMWHCIGHALSEFMGACLYVYTYYDSYACYEYSLKEIPYRNEYCLWSATELFSAGIWVLICTFLVFLNLYMKILKIFNFQLKFTH